MRKLKSTTFFPVALLMTLVTGVGCTQMEFMPAKMESLKASDVFGDDGVPLIGIGDDGSGGSYNGIGDDGIGDNSYTSQLATERICSAGGMDDTLNRGLANTDSVAFRISDYQSKATVCTISSNVRQRILNDLPIDISSCQLNKNSYILTLSPTDDASVNFLVHGIRATPTPVVMKRTSATAAWEFYVDGYDDSWLYEFDSKASRHRLRVLVDRAPASDDIAMNPLCARAASPLVINMTPEGVVDRGLRLTSPARGIFFDILGANAQPVAHTKVKISWPRNQHYMFLALPDANGRVKGIDQLFGDNTRGPDGQFAANGYAALAKYDANADGFIDKEDAVFNQLRLWSDRNFNGASDRGELSSLAEHLIERIDLRYDAGFSERDRHGNLSSLKSVVSAKGGRMHVIFDLWFVLK